MAFVTSPLFTSILYFTFKWESFTSGLNLQGLFQTKWFCDSLLKSQKLPKQLTSLSHFICYLYQADSHTRTQLP